MHRSTWRDELRIIWAIVTKDIVDAIKNRTTLSIILGVSILVLSSMALPLLTRLQKTPVAVIYNPGRSTLIRALTTRDEFRLRIVDSQEEMESTVGGAGELALGLIIPEGFKEAEAAGDSIEISGYIPHWAPPEEVTAQVTFFEEVLSKASWQTIHIDVTDHIAYPSFESMGYPHMVVTALIIAVLIVGMAVVPHLLIEEKETHTFEALLVSPAQYHQIVAGKALTGLFYCLLAGGIVLLLNAQWIVHWWLSIVTVVLGAGFAVMLGLLMGTLFNESSSMNVWMALVLVVLQVPVFLMDFDISAWPALLQTVISWSPSAALDRIAKASIVGSWSDVNLIPSIVLLVGSTLLFTMLVIWRIRREER